MRASEALLLGSTILKPIAGIFNNEQGGGCAMGMIAAAYGGPWMANVPTWMLERRSDLRLPCGCKDEFVVGGGCFPVERTSMEATVQGVVVHLFNYHVCMTGDWTIEKLADWISTMEPVEPEQPMAETAHPWESVPVTA
jgi:hypothetical protein